MSAFNSGYRDNSLDSLSNVTGFNSRTKNESYTLNLINGTYYPTSVNSLIGITTAPSLEYDLNNINSDQTILYNIGSTAGQYDLNNDGNGWSLLDGKLYSDATSSFSSFIPNEEMYNNANQTMFFITQYPKADNGFFSSMLSYWTTYIGLPQSKSQTSPTYHLQYSYGGEFFDEESDGSLYTDEIVLWSFRQDSTSFKMYATTINGTKEIFNGPITEQSISDDNLWVGSGDGFNKASMYFYHLSIFPRTMTDSEFTENINMLSNKFLPMYPTNRTNSYILSSTIDQSFVDGVPDYISTPVVIEGNEYAGTNNLFNCSLTGRYLVEINYSGLSYGIGAGYIYLSQDDSNNTTEGSNTLLSTINAPGQFPRTTRICMNDELQLFAGSTYAAKIIFNGTDGRIQGDYKFKVKYIGPMGPRSYF